MIDIQKPINNIDERPPKKGVPKVRLAAGVALALLVVAIIYVAWIFLSNTRTVKLAEGQTFILNDYSIRISRVMDTICPGLPEVECSESDDVMGAQFQVQNTTTSYSSYGYLALNGSETVEVQGLILELVSVDLEKKTVKLKITEK